MKTKMLADRFVLDRIAIIGQATTIYAKPNTGKTLLVLWMLIDSIKAGRIIGKDVYYVNADDDYRGLVFKTELAEKYDFEMLAPGHNGFESAALQGYGATNCRRYGKRKSCYSGYLEEIYQPDGQESW